MTTLRVELFGQDTLIGSWAALGVLSPGAHLQRARTSLAAVFPAWLPLNNAILLDPPTTATASAAAVELHDVYADDEPVPADRLPMPDHMLDVLGWSIVVGEYAVAGAWSNQSGTDVGIYAVETVPCWRRRGLAKRLMRVLADAYRHGARTASLQSTQMSLPLYTSLQFRPAGRYDEWVPSR